VKSRWRSEGAIALNDGELRLTRVASQLLHRPLRRPPAELVGHLTGVQAQVLSAAGLALRARTRGLVVREVEKARLVDRSVVLCWAMRGTLHLVSSQDHGWLVALLTRPRLPNAYRRLRQEGVPEGQPDAAVRIIRSMLERDGPMTRRELAEGLRAAGVRVDGQAIAHLVWLAAARGVLCYGPDRGKEQCFVLVRDWIGEPPSVEPEAAMAELAVRYLRAHQPAGPADLAAWSGLSQTDASRCWRLVEHRLSAVETSRGTLWSLRGEDRTAAPAGLVNLLPAFDEYLLGWRDRELSLAPEQRRSINRGGGWLRPALLSDGRVVATWNSERSPRALRLRISPFRRLDSGELGGAEREADEVSTYLGAPTELLLDRIDRPSADRVC
jgi:hypothetical protein